MTTAGLFEVFKGLLENYGVLGVFISIASENLGVPFPTEAAYIYSCVLIDRGYSYYLILAVLTAAHLAGSCLAYGLGFWGEVFLAKRLKHNQRFVRVNEWLHRWYAGYGGLTVFATRFIGYLRPWSSFVAGFAQVGFGTFFFGTLLGSLLFNILLLALTFWAIDIWCRFPGHLRVILAFGFFFSGTLLLLAKVAWDRFRRRKLRPADNRKQRL